MGENCKALIEALRNFREEYVLSLTKKAKLKDKYGQIWDVTKIEFDEQLTVIRLGMRGTEVKKFITISWTSNWNELKDYEVIVKGSED